MTCVPSRSPPSPSPTPRDLIAATPVAARLRATRARWCRGRSAALRADGSGSRCASTCHRPSTSPRRPRRSSGRAARPPGRRRRDRRRAGWSMPDRPPSSSSSWSLARLAEHGGGRLSRALGGEHRGRRPVAVLRRVRVHRACCPRRAPRRSRPRPRSGRSVVHADRAELERLVAPVDERVLRRREALARRRGRRGGRCHPRRSATSLRPRLRPDDPTASGAAATDDGGQAEMIGERGSGGAGSTRASRSSKVIAVLDRRPRRGAGGLGGDPRRVDGRRACAPGAGIRGGDARAARGCRGRRAGSTTSGWWRSPGRCRCPLVRDAAVAACTGSRPAAAEALWAALARGTPDPEAAEPAALLALSALLRGDGALANVALRRAEPAWPGHQLTGMLRGLAAAGIRPGELRACLTGVPVPHRDRQRSSASAPRRRRAPRPTRRRKRRR